MSSSSRTTGFEISTNPCGPLVVSKTATVSKEPKILIMGETASLLPSDVNYAYCERSMWIVLGRMMGKTNFQPISDWTKATQKELDEYIVLKDQVLSSGICIWDVYKNIHIKEKKNKKRRKDSNESKVTNDIRKFLQDHPSVKMIAFIGKKALTSFTAEKVLDEEVLNQVELITLPSSSKANSRMTVDEKSNQWVQSFCKYINIGK